MFAEHKPVSKRKKKKRTKLKIDSDALFAKAKIRRTASIDLEERGKKKGERPKNFVPNWSIFLLLRKEKVSVPQALKNGGLKDHWVFAFAQCSPSCPEIQGLHTRGGLLSAVNSSAFLTGGHLLFVLGPHHSMRMEWHCWEHQTAVFALFPFLWRHEGTPCCL